MHLNRQPLTNSTHPHPSHARLALYGYALNALPAGTQFACFTSTKKYSTHPHPSHARLTLSGYSLNALPSAAVRAQFTCFTSTKVQILTQMAALVPRALRLRLPLLQRQKKWLQGRVKGGEGHALGGRGGGRVTWSGLWGLGPR